MNNYKDISEIRQAWDNGEYYCEIPVPNKVREDHVFDENLSVKRNREMAVEWNENVEQLKKDKMAKQADLYRQLKEDVVEYLMGTYGFTRKQAEAIESYTYIEKHSFMCDYFSGIDSFAELVENVLNAK